MKWLLTLGCAVVLSACIQEGGNGLNPQRIDIRGDDFGRPESDQPVTTEARGRSRTHVDLGLAYMRSGNYGTALDEAKIAVAYDSSYAPAHLLLAQTYALLEQYPTADAAYGSAKRLAPSDPEVNNSYGWFLCSQKREKEGIPMLRSVTKNPYYRTPTRAYANLGLCYLSLGDNDAAEQAFIQAYQADASNSTVLLYLSNLNYQARNFEGARHWMDTLQKQVASPSAEVLWLALRIEHAQGNRSGEASYAAKLRKDFPSSPEYKAFLQGKYE